MSAPITPHEAEARLVAMVALVEAVPPLIEAYEALLVAHRLGSHKHGDRALTKMEKAKPRYEQALAACADVDALVAALRQNEPDTAHEVYMERCRAMFVIEQAFGCRRIEDEPCSCAACVVREKIMGSDPPASASVPPGETPNGGG